MNKSILKHEDELFLKCSNLNIDSKAEFRIKELLAKNLDWNYVQQMVTKHKLIPIFFYNITKIHPKIFPEEFAQFLREFFDYNARKNLFMWSELLKILKCLELNGINAISYKGPTLASLAYGNLALREFNDVDIFVYEKDVIKSIKIITLLGYETRLNLLPNHVDQYIKHQREYKFNNLQKNLEVEIHWNVAGTSFSFPNNSVFPINNIIKVQIGHQIINSFSNEDLILILSLHAAKHQWDRLSWVNDICGLIIRSKDLNWDIIIEKAKYLHMEKILYLNLYLAKELFDLELPVQILKHINGDASLKELVKKIIMISFNIKSPSIFTRIILRFKLRDGILRGFNDIWRILTIPTSEEWKDFEKKRNLRLNYILLRSIQLFYRLKEL